MFRKISYRQELFFYFFIVFMIFTTVIIAFQYHREKQYKTESLESVLESYTDLVNSFMQHQKIFRQKEFKDLDSIAKIFPRNDIRITIIRDDGLVLYDNYKAAREMENHKERPEIQKAKFSYKGTHVRLSETTNQPFYYYAKSYDGYYVRTAIEYSVSIKEFLQVENIFFYFIILLFILISGILIFVSDKVGKSILKLKDFALKAGKDEMFSDMMDFPNNELGTIGKQIVSIYNDLKDANRALKNEKEKLILHLQMSQKGIAVFSKENKKILANNHFIQYLNLISDTPAINADHFLQVKEFFPVKKFIKQCLTKLETGDATFPVKSWSIEKEGRFFNIQCVVFQDTSYEVSIHDVTKVEKQKKMKQEMTSNIAHELRTPVSSIRGYLETLLSTKNITKEKQHYFIEKASAQIERLSELISDIAMLNKIEEASGLFEIEEVGIASIVNDVIENLHGRIEENNIKISHNIKNATKVRGNKMLIYSVFQNLMENALKYGGENITIFIDEYLETENNIFISFADNGVGIDPIHQSRIFERFYRIDKGRARNNGGTGLGLAIVKNAVLFHQGEISVKNRKGGGAEFLFSLAKNITDESRNNQ